MALLGGLIGKLIGLAVLLLVGALAIGVWAYASDYPVAATVTDKECASSTPVIFVKTKLFGIEDSTQVTAQQCGMIQEGNFVEYHLRTQRTTIYHAEGGACIYDSVSISC